MRQTINKVKQTLEQKRILWAYPTAQKLQENHYSLAIQWVGECLRIYASEFKPEKLSNLDKYIQQALDSQNSLTSLLCREISREIWYLPEREEFQTAIARLWASLAAFKDGEGHGGIMQAGAAVELVLPDLSNRPLLERYLEAAVRICEEYEKQSTIG